MKKFIKSLGAFALAAAVAATSAVNVFAGEVFTDIDDDSEVGIAVGQMYDKGYIAGYNDGTFKPDGSITRAELVRIVNQTLQFEKSEAETANAYSDVIEGAWYYDDLIIAQEQGYVAGFPDGTFRPNENITRQQFCTIVSQLFSFRVLDDYTEKVSDEISPWANDYVYAVLSHGIMSLEEGNAFRATQNITRGEVCLAMAKFIIDDDIDSIISDAAGSDNDGSTGSKGSSSRTGSSSGGGSSSSSSSSDSSDGTSSSSGGSGGGSSGGSGGSSGGTSGSTSSTETTTVTEAQTETTTAAPVTEPETETTTVSAATISTLNNVYKSLQYAQVNAPNTQVRNFIKSIRSCIKSYLDDPAGFDIDGEADNMISQYKSLSETDKASAQDLILDYCSLSELSYLKNTFFPDVVI